MIEVRPGGRRRIDRVLAPGFADGLAQLPVTELRTRRDEAAQEEADLAYLRRLLQARIDIVHAERRRRSGSASTSLVTQLVGILAEITDPQAGADRYQTLGPSRAEAHRRHVEALVADVDLSDVGTLSGGQLGAALRAYQGEKKSVSQRRDEVAQVLDRLNTEIGARYARGEASVDDLLTAEDE